MGCNCQKRQKDDHREEVFKLLEDADLRAVGEQVTAIPETTASMIRHLQKAERAERLELGADVATLYRQAAERDRVQGIRQFQAAITRLDERTSRGDWDQFVVQTRQEFEQRDGPTLLEEARGRLRLEVMEMDGFSGEDAAVTVGVFDESVDRSLADGLNGAARLLRERLESGLEALQSPEMGREPASPQTRSQLECIGIFSVLAVIAMIMCGVAWGCWCCIGVWIIVWLAAMIALCWAFA